MIRRGCAPVATGPSGSGAWLRLVAVWGPVVGENFPGPTESPPRDPPASFRVSPHESEQRWQEVDQLCSALDADWRQMVTSPPGRSAVQRWVDQDPCSESAGSAHDVLAMCREGSGAVAAARSRTGGGRAAGTSGAPMWSTTARQMGGGSEGRATLAWSSARCSRASRSWRLMWGTTTPLLVDQRRAEGHTCRQRGDCLAGPWAIASSGCQDERRATAS